MNDYERVASIIRFLDAEHIQQPDLDDLATRSGLSRFHFHRLFSRWAGATPKDFLQCLTLAHARKCLEQGESVLGAAIESGLSSPGRLHDLCITLEAATPGEIKSGGEGWTIEVGFTDSPFGVCCIGVGPRGVCHLTFLETRDRTEAMAPLMKSWPRARVIWNDDVACRVGKQIFERPSTPTQSGIRQNSAALRAFVRATPFQIRVWRALLRVPHGALISYGSLAATIGSPTAARAVGTAVGTNPIAFLIPCHRVIRETGIIGEYRWGPERKRLMLGWEGTTAFTPTGPLPDKSKVGYAAAESARPLIMKSR